MNTTSRRFTAAAFLTALTVCFCFLPVSISLAQDDAAAQAVVDAINRLRTSEGLPPLARDAHLDQAAVFHSQEMVQVGRLEHVSEGSGTPANRVARTGYNATTVAENVAFHSASVDGAHRAIENSPPHRANILREGLTHVGVGIARSSDRIYLTQVFATGQSGGASVPAVTAPPVVAAPAVVASTPAAPQAARPSAVVSAPATAAAPAAATSAPATSAPATSAPGGVAGYWVCRQGYWWYFPNGSGTGGRLTHDPNVQGPPDFAIPGTCQLRDGRFVESVPVGQAPAASAPSAAAPPVTAPAAPAAAPRRAPYRSRHRLFGIDFSVEVQ